MNRIIHCDVDNEFIRGAGVVIGAAGSHDDVELELSFSPMWDGTSKKIVWFDALNEQTVVTALTTDMLVNGNGNLYRVSVPWEAKAVEGDMKLTIRGASVTGGTEERAVVAATACFKVLPALWDPLAVEGSEPSAAVSDQLQQEIEDIKQDIVDAALAADSKAAAASSASAAASSAAAAAASASNAATSAAQAATSASGAASSASNAAASASELNSRKINGKPLSADITLTAAEVGAIPSTGMDLNRPLEFKSPTSDGWISVYTIAPDRERVESLITPYYMSTKRVRLTDSPTNGTDAANKSYVDGKVAAVTPDSIGAAAVGHSHSPFSLGAAPEIHTHDPAQLGALPEKPKKIELSDTYGYVSMGSSALQYDEYTKTIACVIGDGGAIYPTLAPFGCDTPTADYHAANKKYVDGAVQECLTQTQADGRYLKLSGGTMTGTLYAQRNTGYGTSQVRNIYFTTTDLTAGSSSLNSGDIAIVYE